MLAVHRYVHRAVDEGHDAVIDYNAFVTLNMQYPMLLWPIYRLQ